MIHEFTGTGKTREEAAKAAENGLMAQLAAAGIKRPERAELHEEVVALPKKKFFGLLGSTDAVVKMSYDDGVKERKPRERKKPQQAKNAQRKQQSPAKAAKPAAQKSERAERAQKPERPRRAEAQARPETHEEELPEITEKDVDIPYAVSYLKAVVDGLRVENAQITGAVNNGVLELTVDCDDYGIIIGRRGETLDSLQYLTGLALKKVCGRYIRVSIIVGDYREKRNETLKNMAIRQAQRVERTGRRFTFEPMNPYERRIIHTSVQEVEGVESYSVGEGTERRVVIAPEGGERFNPRRSGRPGGRPGGRPSGGRGGKKPAALPKDFTKFGKIEAPKPAGDNEDGE